MDSTREFSDMAQRLFGDLCGPREIEQAEDGRHPQVLWDAAMEAGLGVVLVDEGSGGVGGSLADAGAILRVAGGYAAPGPWLETMLGNQARVVAGLEPLDGPLALVFAPLGAATAPVDLRGVAWATTVAQVLVLSEQEGHAQLSVWTPEAFDAVPAPPDTSGEPRFDLRLRSQVPGIKLRGASWSTWFQRAALLRAAQMVGAIQWCLARSSAYALERKQFGREIGKFQAVQQMMAELASASVAATSITDAALASPENQALLAAARSRLGDAVDTACAISHQVHGALGFSHEYPLHFRTRRLSAWRDTFGTVAHWRRMLAERFAGCQADDVWARLTAASQ